VHACADDENDSDQEMHPQMRSLYGDTLRAACHLQAGARNDLLPRTLLL